MTVRTTARSTRSMWATSKDLMPVWTFSTGVTEAHEAPPIVNNGVMFVATPQGQVLALDAKSGRPVLALQAQTARRSVPAASDQPRRRPLARQGLSRDHRLLPRRARRKNRQGTLGEEVQDYKKGHYMTLAPQVINGKILVGASGGELGIRGLHRGLRRHQRQRAVAHLYDPRSRRAGTRDVERR